MGRTEIAGFRRKLYKTLQAMARKTATFYHNINGIDVVQGELGKVGQFLVLYAGGRVCTCNPASTLVSQDESIMGFVQQSHTDVVAGVHYQSLKHLDRGKTTTALWATVDRRQKA